MYQLAFFVPGEPVAKGRARSSPYRKKDGGLGVRTYSPDKTVTWERTLKYEALKMKPTEPLDGPLRIELHFYFPRNKAAKKRPYPHVRPDLDNLEKAVMDALNGVIWTDDARVCSKTSAKHYTNDAGQIGVAITVEMLEEVSDER